MKLSKFLILIGFITVFAMGCDRESTDLETMDLPVIDPVDVYVGTSPFNRILYPNVCVEFVYPIQVELENGDIESAADYDALYFIILVKKTVNYSYPLEIISNGETKQINNAAELYIEDCKGGGFVYGELKSCSCYQLDLEYPIATIDQLGMIKNATDLNDFHDITTDWKITRTSNDDFLEFVYPVTLIDSNTNVEYIAENYDDFVAFVNITCD